MRSIVFKLKFDSLEFVFIKYKKEQKENQTSFNRDKTFLHAADLYKYNLHVNEYNMLYHFL